PGTIVLPLRPVAPLSTVVVPSVFGIEGILADKTAAIQLGKALFWDMQAGSDDSQACASCHFNAGADSRPANVINPGQAGGDNSFQLGIPINGANGPNYMPHAGNSNAGFGGYHDGDFPFHKLADVNDRMTAVADVNDVAGSAGVFSTRMGQVTVVSTSTGGRNLQGDGGTGNLRERDSDGDDAGISRNVTGVNAHRSINRGPQRPRQGSGGGSQAATGSGQITSVETTTPMADAVFSYPDPSDASKVINVRQVTGRNTPSVVDAIFNFRNFWDGRAQNTCNGNNPFGGRDATPHLLAVNPVDGKLSSAFVAMQNSSLCSQALGPILSSVEMSAAGRDFHQVGKKLLARQPLAKQLVDPTDSVLGSFSNAPNHGINVSYASLIQKAFLPEWWQFKDHICLGSDGAFVGTVNPTNSACGSGTQEYSLMEYNFSLFWGVAIQMYESTLVADK